MKYILIFILIFTCFGCGLKPKNSISEIIPIERKKFKLPSCKEENPSNPEVCIKIIDPSCLAANSAKCCNGYALCAGDAWYVSNGSDFMIGKLYKINIQSKQETILSNFQIKGNNLVLSVPDIGKLSKEEKLLISFTPTDKLTKTEEFEIKRMDIK